MPVHARRLIRKMRGGAQAQLLECDDGNHYVVKFTNNPQHRRILVNEWMSAAFLEYLGISAPPVEVVEVDSEFLDSQEDACFRLGSTRRQIEPGWHFGSRYPGHPERLAVYDFLPDQLLDRVANLRDMIGVLVFDKWMGNADARQAIFFRARLKEWLPSGDEHPLKVGFVAQMIDHGYVFNGPEWTFADARAQGFYFRKQVYRGVRGLDDFQPWLDRIVNFPEEVADRAWRRMPPAWLRGEEEDFEKLLRRLMRRRERVPELLREAAEARPGPFPDWARG